MLFSIQVKPSKLGFSNLNESGSRSFLPTVSFSRRETFLHQKVVGGRHPKTKAAES